LNLYLFNPRIIFHSVGYEIRNCQSLAPKFLLKINKGNELATQFYFNLQNYFINHNDVGRILLNLSCRISISAFLVQNNILQFMYWFENLQQNAMCWLL